MACISAQITADDISAIKFHANSQIIHPSVSTFPSFSGQYLASNEVVAVKHIHCELHT